MPRGVSIDFQRIRPHHGDQRLGFEEFMRQLLAASPPAGSTRLEHKGAGADGGVEVLAHFADGTQHGYQSKFLTQPFTSREVGQLRTSFQSALTSYPAMTQWTVALPRNLPGRAGVRSQRQVWDEFVAEAVASAHALGRCVTVNLMDETALIHLLTSAGPLESGLRSYWFDETVLTAAWFEARFRTAKADLDERFHSDDHVDVSIQQTLEVIARGPRWRELVEAHKTALDAVHPAARKLAPLIVRPDGDAEVEAFLQALNDCRTSFSELPFGEAASFDLSPYLAQLKTTLGLPGAKSLDDAGYAIDGEATEAASLRRHARYIYQDTLGELHHTALALPKELLHRHRLTLVGEAGAGKSHSLAHMVERHVGDGAPAVMMLGQSFTSGDPRSQILNLLSLSTTPFNTFLGAMQAAASAADRPALIVIDALNEARDFAVWTSGLAGLAAEIAAFDKLVLVVSCRDVYEADCVPASLSRPRLAHRGFQGDGATAAKAYLDRHGIDRPAAPFLDAEFTNPLFLTTCVKRLEAEGLKAFPQGLDGVSRLFDFWLDGIERSLVRRGYRRISVGDGRLRAAIRRFADKLMLEQAESLPTHIARPLIEQDVAAYHAEGPLDELIQRLMAEGVLRRVRMPPGEPEHVAFTFQRFSDHFIAGVILDFVETPEALITALKPGGDFAHLLADDSSGQHGVIAALMVQVPERFGEELHALEPGLGETLNLDVDSFFESLRWRTPSAVRAAGVALIDTLWADPTSRSAVLELLLQVSSHPGHALNADHLHRRLSDMPMPERDAMFANGLVTDDEDGPAPVLIDWAVSADLHKADPQRVRLVAMAITWFLSSSDRTLRDLASHALARIFRTLPALSSDLIEAFADVDDAYVRERVLAAAYASALWTSNDTGALRAAARSAWRSVFARQPVDRHIFIRHFARGLIELAAVRGVLEEGIDLALARPPYASEPITQWPAAAEVGTLRETAQAIVSSVAGYYHEEEDRFSMPGDFGNYTMGSLASDFGAACIADGPPPTKGDRRAAFWRRLQSSPPPIPNLAAEALEARKALNDAEHDRAEVFFGGRAADQRALEEAVAAAEEVFEAADQRLRAALPEASTPARRLSYPGHGDDHFETFDASAGRRWVAARAAALGWRQGLHEQAERGRSAGRRDHAIERIGKKYQWIAYHELLGHLADHHWRIRWRDAPEVLQDVLEVEDLDIDLSFAGVDAGGAPRDLPLLSMPRTDLTRPDSIEAAVAWAEGSEDLPNPPDLIEGRDDQGRRWWLVHSWRQDDGYLDKLQVDGPTRTSQGHIQLVVMAAADAAAFCEKTRELRANLADLSEDDHYRHRLFAEHGFETARDDPLLNHAFLDFLVGRLTHDLSPHRGEYDFGGVDKLTFEAPRGAVLRGLGLRPAGPSKPWFIDSAGRPAMIDWRPYDPDRRCVMIDADVLESWLVECGLAAVWTYWGEKDGGAGSGENFSKRGGRFARETFSGAWRRDGDKWRGAMWKAGPEHPRLDYP